VAEDLSLVAPKVVEVDIIHTLIQEVAFMVVAEAVLGTGVVVVMLAETTTMAIVPITYPQTTGPACRGSREIKSSNGAVLSGAPTLYHSYQLYHKPIYLNK
jgi:hypothetical protein